MDNIWILVANSSIATLYNFLPGKSFNLNKDLTIVDKYEHPDSRKSDSALVSDREGQYVNQGSGGHGNYVEPSDPHQYQAVIFARELVHHLEQGRGAQKFKSLILVAPPEFLGHLRHCLDTHAFQKMSVKEFVKDYTKAKLPELAESLELDKYC